MFYKEQTNTIKSVNNFVLLRAAACPSTAVGARFCRPTSTCIFASQLCDTIQDCPDDSDEVNCSMSYMSIFNYATCKPVCLDSFARNMYLI